MPISPNPPRIDWITLSVEDLDRASGFYEAMGFGRPKRISDGVLGFELGGGATLAISAAKTFSGLIDAGEESCRPGGVLLSRNVDSASEVRELIERLQALGGSLTREMGETPWGTFSGWVLDPDGHPWEICFNPRLIEHSSES
ncbi:MAG: VOC family protein [Phycisphaerales bacterium]|nr:VOC family protein [Phycisphaerales bacterium]